MFRSRIAVVVLSVVAAAALAACAGSPAAPDAVEPEVAAAAGGGGGEGVLSASGRGDGPIVYVISQDLYYDSIVTADPLPPKGPFQQLFPPDSEDPRLRTEYGPGNKGYAGGRWWVDVNGDNEMNEGDHFFSCPLLGPGRAQP